MVATAGLVVLGVVQTNNAVAVSADADRAKVLAGTATATVHLVHELERELAETAALRQRGGEAGRQLVTAQRQRVDAAAERYRSAAAAARTAAPDLGNVLDAVDAQLDQLNDTRANALQGAAADLRYNRLSESLLGVADALPTQLENTELANAAREVAAVAAQEHFAAVERDLLRGVFVRGQPTSRELVQLGQMHGAQLQRQAEFSRIASPSSAHLYSRLLDGSDVTAARQMRDAVLTSVSDGPRVDADVWYVAQSGTIRRYYLVGLELTERLDDLASEFAAAARNTAWATRLGTGALALVSLLAAVLLSVRTSRRLQGLRAAALSMASRELPQRIAEISAGKRDPGDQEGVLVLAPDITRGYDEISQVADAFDTVSRSALRLAGEQAELRVDVARIAETLARRIRTLITRQIRLLDEFERDETDPDVLARLFALDHLAARLRRNGDNLLVLAGGEPDRSHPGSYRLSEVVAAAAAEIDEFARVESDVPDVAVQGSVVGHLVHLLAELLENATSFSPPHSIVKVDARQTVDGLILRVNDNGIGISPNRLEEVNARLAAPATLSSTAAGSMGLHVVAHLAARHKIRVRLSSTGTGTVAFVEIPETALTRTGLTTRLRSAFTGRAAVGPVTGPTGAPGRAAGNLPLRPVPPAPYPAPLVRPVAGGLPMPPCTKGARLTPQLNVPHRPKSDDLLDPEQVRARLSALAEGVAAAMRRSPNSK